MLPMPDTRDWSSRARLISVLRPRSRAMSARRRTRVDRVARDVAICAGTVSPGTSAPAPDRRPARRRRSAGRRSAAPGRRRRSSIRTCRCRSSGVATGCDEQLAAHPEVGDQALISLGLNTERQRQPEVLAPPTRRQEPGTGQPGGKIRGRPDAGGPRGDGEPRRRRSCGRRRIARARPGRSRPREVQARIVRTAMRRRAQPQRPAR